jgi:hypothetical protein
MNRIPKSLNDFLVLLFYAAGFPIRRIECESFYWEREDCDRKLRVTFTESCAKGLWNVSVKYTKTLWGRKCNIFAHGHFNVWEPLREANLVDACMDRVREIQNLVITIRESDLADVYIRREHIAVIFDNNVTAFVDYRDADKPMNVWHSVQGTRLTHEQMAIFEGCEYEGVRS